MQVYIHLLAMVSIYMYTFRRFGDKQELVTVYLLAQCTCRFETGGRSICKHIHQRMVLCTMCVHERGGRWEVNGR